MLIIILILLVILVGVVYYFIRPKESFKSIKTIKYFGADYCPYSNKESPAYIVLTDLEKKYKDAIDVQYYWSEIDGDKLKEYNVEYIPTILNGNNEPIEIGLPKNTDTKNKSTSELKELLLETLYSKL